MISEEFKIQNPNSKIGVLLVDDSPLALTILKRMLSTSADIEVVGTAENGKEALKLIPKMKPTVLCTDLHMPVMDGLELTKEIMRTYPMPILVLSVSVREGSTNVFKLLEAGAVDVMLKPKGGLESEFEKAKKELLTKIRIISGVRVFRRYKKEDRSSELGVVSASRAELKSKFQIPKPKIIIIGASTGGPQAIHEILRELPTDFPLPVICIQHISEGFLKSLVEWLDEQCRIKVRIAENGESPSQGTVYFPQEGTHLKIDNSGRFVCSTESSIYGHRPSITVTMRSLVQHYGKDVIAVLLTGMGGDGSEGMLAVQLSGGMTIAQDEKSSVVFGMPKQAIELGGAQHVLPLEEISNILMKMPITNSEVSSALPNPNSTFHKGR